MAITKDQIFAVADELDAVGQNPTLAAVRKALGGGSFTTISEAMTEWKARKATKDQPLREPAPPALAEKLGAFGAELWAIALELANGRLASERDALEKARTQLETEKAEAVELADQVTAETESLKLALTAAKEAEATARSEGETLRQDLAQVRMQAATAEARASEIEKRAEDLSANIRRLDHQVTELSAALADRESRVTRLSEELATATARLEQVTSEAQAMGQRTASLDRELKDRDGRLAKLAEELATVTVQRDEERKRAGHLATEQERLTQQNGELVKVLSAAAAGKATGTPKKSS